LFAAFELELELEFEFEFDKRKRLEKGAPKGAHCSPSRS